MLSLEMQVEEVDGVIVIFAPWLEVPVTGATFFEAYEKARMAAVRPRTSRDMRN